MNALFLSDVGTTDRVHLISINLIEVAGLTVADMLNVSSPHLTKLLKTREIRLEAIGKHRRVPLHALMQYRLMIAQRQEEAMELLARLGQQYNILPNTAGQA